MCCVTLLALSLTKSRVKTWLASSHIDKKEKEYLLRMNILWHSQNINLNFYLKCSCFEIYFNKSTIIILFGTIFMVLNLQFILYYFLSSRHSINIAFLLSLEWELKCYRAQEYSIEYFFKLFLLVLFFFYSWNHGFLSLGRSPCGFHVPNI